MTNETNPDAGALLALAEQHGGEDFLRALLSWALHQVMEAEVGEPAWLGKGEHALCVRENSHNGCCLRDRDTINPCGVADCAGCHIWRPGESHPRCWQYAERRGD